MAIIILNYEYKQILIQIGSNKLGSSLLNRIRSAVIQNLRTFTVRPSQAELCF